MRAQRIACHAGALLLASIATCTSAAEPSRFSGSGTLREHAATDSDDGRFRVEARLGRGDAGVSGGRFALDARLAPSQLTKSVAAISCSELFLNGFEG